MTDKSKSLNILKNAFFMERQGKSLYETARDSTKDPAVKGFFQALADDEQAHMDILEKQFKACMSSGKFVAGGYENDGAAEPAPEILTDDVKARINAAGFEATAITAAIAFEENAVKLYALRSEETDDPEEKKLYKWLSVWETTHLKKLVALQEGLMERVWEDNNFWPF